jgi:hypothetical protein
VKPKSKAEIQAILAVIDRALEEFRQQGKGTTVTCDACTGLLSVVALGSTAWRLDCPCGRYRDTLRGL